MRPLWTKHFEEIATFKDIPLNPDIDIYRRLDDEGTLRIYTARAHGILIGYQIFFVRANPHYQQSIQAVQDILFMEPSIRRGLTAYKFIKWCDDELAKEDVQVIYAHIKIAHDFSPLLRRLGYQDHDKVMARRIK